MTLPSSAKVLVVGAGPTGLTAAVALLAAGRDVALIDANAEGANTSRAAVVHARTPEVLEDLDVTRRLLAEGLIVDTFTVRDSHRLVATTGFERLDTKFPYTLMIPQSRTEAILSARLRELGGHAFRGFKALGIEQRNDGALVTVDGPEGAQQIHAEFLVGADGMHSTIRAAAGIDFVGAPYGEDFVLADVEMSWPLPGHEVQLFFGAAGLVVVAPLPNGRHRIVATRVGAATSPTIAELQEMVDVRGPAGARIRDIAWASSFRVHHRVASTYRSGRTVLAGDAAHVHSPAGGQGMNTGVQDAIDLAATLVKVLEGKPLGPALDGYVERRRKVALGVVIMTDRMTRAATLHNAIGRHLRNAAVGLVTRVPTVNERIARTLAELPAKR